MAETAVVGYGHEDYGEGIFCDHYGDPMLITPVAIYGEIFMVSTALNSYFTEILVWYIGQEHCAYYGYYGCYGYTMIIIIIRGEHLLQECFTILFNYTICVVIFERQFMKI